MIEADDALVTREVRLLRTEEVRAATNYPGDAEAPLPQGIRVVSGTETHGECGSNVPQGPQALN